MEEGASGGVAGDQGLLALVMLLRFHGVGAEPEQIRHRLGSTRVGVTEMVRCAKQLGLRARARKSNWSRLETTPLRGSGRCATVGF
jgi:ATP-binding cassette, subfamily B, bacterial HlyB/CyaB